MNLNKKSVLMLSIGILIGSVIVGTISITKASSNAEPVSYTHLTLPTNREV